MMKKALQITFGTVLAGVVTTACATPDDLLQHTAVHANGTYMRATSNGTSYGDLLQAGTGTPPNFGSARASFVHPDNQFDWGAGLTYHIPGTLTRVFFHYDHFDDGSNTEGAGGLFGLGVNATGAATSTVNDRSQEFTLGLDRRIEVGPRFYIDTGAFIEWDKIHRNQFLTNQNAANRATLDVDSKMRGWGPGVGIKGHATPFSSYNGFGIFASALTTLLYARNDFQWTHVLNNQLADVLDPEETHSVVGKLDISLGIDYECPIRIDNRNKLQLGIALGARYVNYMNALKNGNMMYNPNPSFNNYSIYSGTSEDWGRVGPFLQIRIGGGHS